MDFSVLLPLYFNDKKTYVEQAIDSILNQTYMPSEIIILLDGSIKKDVRDLLETYYQQRKDLFKIIEFLENRGLGEVLKIGVEISKFDYIARMDADDIARKDRFEKQISYLIENPNVDLVGSYISEFIESPSKIISTRKVPQNNDQIKKFVKKRSPFNHMTVMFKKSAILEAGNYTTNLKYLEDYYLWIRLLDRGFITHNIPESLVYARVGHELYKRRGGLAYFKNELKLQDYALQIGIINVYEFAINIITRFFIRLCPNIIRSKIYLLFLRN